MFDSSGGQNRLAFIKVFQKARMNFDLNLGFPHFSGPGLCRSWSVMAGSTAAST